MFSPHNNMGNEEALDYSWGAPVDSKRYEWQLLVGNQWLRIENDHVIETHYCHAGAKGITINTQHGKVFIDFDKLQILTGPLKVQRLSFLPPGQTEDVGWYFRDDQLWREYGSLTSSRLSSSISSKDVEHQFTLNPQGSFTFTVGSASYRLDFATMTQTNCTTGLRRNVRRRPKFPSNTRSLYSTSAPPTASSSQLTNGGYKWEFMGEEGEWTEYQAHVCSFDSAAIETQYQLNPQGKLHFNIRRFSYTLNFTTMCQINNQIGTARAVRRTADDGSQQNSSWDSQPRWQFQDIGGKWKDYSKGRRQCSMSSQDIELEYQKNPSGTVIFTTSNFSYELNFSAMTQKNLSTTTTRSVRRLNQ
ncbi:protein mono-ADP-ribosyltransferase PARP12-like isoform X1 [Morone saxatilis]|uniref:protein mono-ADP-ribosyltransferase PARP12-like isoform X1 n=1 Tax=Morone saxatilis TaxID=34816 RepID=UPI0015E1EC99|nr:protein mono-ADP-ribosyltransferase PARP12-like isoform X1 [Morone saxatilis]